jgi:hypothetical protein
MKVSSYSLIWIERGGLGCMELIEHKCIKMVDASHNIFCLSIYEALLSLPES